MRPATQRRAKPVLAALAFLLPCYVQAMCALRMRPVVSHTVVHTVGHVVVAPLSYALHSTCLVMHLVQPWRSVGRLSVVVGVGPRVAPRVRLWVPLLPQLLQVAVTA